jgi:hypothetical protein
VGRSSRPAWPGPWQQWSRPGPGQHRPAAVRCWPGSIWLAGGADKTPGWPGRSDRRRPGAPSRGGRRTRRVRLTQVADQSHVNLTDAVVHRQANSDDLPVGLNHKRSNTVIALDEGGESPAVAEAGVKAAVGADPRQAKYVGAEEVPAADYRLPVGLDRDGAGKSDALPSWPV